jgi:guanylate kinase
MNGQLFVISAPSGTGKSTLLGEVRKRMTLLGYSVSHTTRKPREGEQEGRDYSFVDKQTFKRMADEGLFLEWAEVYGDYYGTSFSAFQGQLQSGLDVLLDLDIQGARAVKEHFSASVLVFLLPPSLKVLEARLRNRGTDEKEVIEARLKKARNEIAEYSRYDYVIINDELEQAITEVQAVILSERSRTGRRGPIIKELFGL